MELNFKTNKEFTDFNDTFKGIIKINKEYGRYKELFMILCLGVASAIIFSALYNLTHVDIFKFLLILPVMLIGMPILFTVEDILRNTFESYIKYYKGTGYYESNKFIVQSIENIYSETMKPELLYKKINYSLLNDQSKSASIKLEACDKLNNILNENDIFYIKENEQLWTDKTSKLIEIDSINKYSNKEIINKGKLITIAK